MSVVARRGDIWWTDLGPPRGSSPAGRRPVVIVQADALTRSALNTVVVVGITSNLARADDPGNVALPRSASRLPKPSVVNVTQIATIDRRLLASRVSRLPTALLERVDEGLRLVLGV